LIKVKKERKTRRRHKPKKSKSEIAGLAQLQVGKNCGAKKRILVRRCL